MTLEEFRQALEGHDWYYDWSDDGRAYRAGRDNQERLVGIARSGGREFMRAFNAAQKNHIGRLAKSNFIPTFTEEETA